MLTHLLPPLDGVVTTLVPLPTVLAAVADAPNVAVAMTITKESAVEAALLPVAVAVIDTPQTEADTNISLQLALGL